MAFSIAHKMHDGSYQIAAQGYVSVTRAKAAVRTRASRYHPQRWRIVEGARIIASCDVRPNQRIFWVDGDGA